MKLSTAVEATMNRWNIEAILFCAAHGRKGGQFEFNRWANGKVMAEVPGARANQAIPIETYIELHAADWNGYRFCS